MSKISPKRRIWGWFFFDWSSQPYNTLLITFIFAPYVNELLGDGSAAQSAWGFGIGAAAFLTALAAPILGASADLNGTRMRWMWVFSIMYVIGALGVWLAAPGDFNLLLVLILFAIGIIGMEMGTIFTNAMLPQLGSTEEIGRISGSGFAFGYLGGLIALVIMLLLFAENAKTGKTLIGLDPLFGLNAEEREGTRFVGPFSALWYVVFMIPFFLWVRETPKPQAQKGGSLGDALSSLWGSIRALPQRPSLFSYLGASMLYRDGLTGMYAFGGIYASGVLGWSITKIGIFGILAIVASAFFAWVGGYADKRFGPKPVIVFCVTILCFVAGSIIFITPTSLYGIEVGPDSAAPDIAFYILGSMIGAAGGVLQSASRTMMVRQAHPDKMTEGFGLYALAGKATSFIAPISIGFVTTLSGSQQIGIAPLFVLFVLGLILLRWVR